MLGKKVLKKIVAKMDRKAIADKMIAELLYWRGTEGTVFTELDMNTGDIEVDFRADASPRLLMEHGIWLSQITTHNIEEIPPASDLPDFIVNAEDDVAEYYKTYAVDIIEFIDEVNLDKQIEKFTYYDKLIKQGYWLSPDAIIDVENKYR